MVFETMRMGNISQEKLEREYIPEEGAGKSNTLRQFKEEGLRRKFGKGE